MTLKGDYSGLTSYSVGDVVKWTDGTVFILRKPCTSGTPPTDSLYWERMVQPMDQVVRFILDGVSMAEGGALTGKVANNLTTTASGKVLDARQGKTLKGYIDAIKPDDKTLQIKSSTASSTKVFDITVDDSGELTATEHT